MKKVIASLLLLVAFSFPMSAFALIGETPTSPFKQPPVKQNTRPKDKPCPGKWLKIHEPTNTQDVRIWKCTNDGGVKWRNRGQG